MKGWKRKVGSGIRVEERVAEREKKVTTMRKKMMRWGFLSLLLASGALCHALSEAKQLHFDKRDKRDEGEDVVFSYRYQDSAQRVRGLHFALSRRAIAEAESLLLDRNSLDRALYDFGFVEGNKAAARRLAVLQADFDVALADIQRSIKTFNRKRGGRLVSLRLKKPLKLQVKRVKKKPWGIEVSSQTPGWRFGNSSRSFDKKSHKEADKFVEDTHQRVSTLSAEFSQRLSLARKGVLADLRVEKIRFYTARYLRFFKDENRTQIDYVRIAEQALPSLQPVAQAFRKNFQGKSERELAAEVLHFFQNIPYNDLMKGKVRGFKGFAPPIQVIARNLGDCDSKSTAVMALLRLLLEKRSLAIFLVPNHAFLGVEIETKKGDDVYTHEGKTYVLMETAGPGAFPIGELSKTSKKHLKAGRIDDIITLPPR